jgi:hypothetical protein
MFFGEEVDLFAFDVHDADDAVVDDEGDGDFAADAAGGFDVANVFGGIGDADGVAGAEGGAGDAAGDGDVTGFAFIEAEAEAVAEELAGIVDEEDAEAVELDELAEAGGDFLKEVIEVEDGGEFLGEFGEDLEGTVVLVDTAVEAGVFDGGGNAAGDEAEEGDFAFAVGVEASAFEVDDADEAAAGEHGDGEFAADGIEGIEVTGIGAGIADIDGLAGLGGGADDAFAEFDFESADEFVAVADGVADLEVFVTVAVKEDGEKVEADDAVEDVGDVIEDLIEIESGGGGVGDFEEEIEEIGAFLEADFAFPGAGHQYPPWGAGRPETIAMLAEAPMRVAPASIMRMASS